MDQNPSFSVILSESCVTEVPGAQSFPGDGREPPGREDGVLGEDVVGWEGGYDREEDHLQQGNTVPP